MGLRLRSLLIVRVLPNTVGVGVALSHLRRFVRYMRQDYRLIHKTLFVGIVARPLQVRQNVV
jgi:ABC-type ATPase involved in cell division